MTDDNDEIASGEDIIETTDVCIVRRDKGQAHSLTLGELAELMAFYGSKYPKFARLEALYEAEKRCARIARKLLAFPPMCSWQPESHHLSPEEAQMLQGGDACVNKYHLVHIASKGASWVLRAEELEAEKREGTYTKSSFVSLEVAGAPAPSFGRVQHFFQHSFAGQCHDFAVVNLYGRPQQDARSMLWYVPTTAVAGRSVVEISKLSKPLVTAPDTDKLWFLNFI